MTATERTIRIQLICEAPPTDPGTAFGLQDGVGTLAPGTPAADGTLRFDTEIRAVTVADGTVRLRGPVVHGPWTAPFLYLSCRPADASGPPWIFRLKVPLAGIDASASSVRGRIRTYGGGSVPLADGWQTVER